LRRIEVAANIDCESRCEEAADDGDRHCPRLWFGVIIVVDAGLEADAETEVCRARPSDVL
jgi:hypothetical protein